MKLKQKLQNLIEMKKPNDTLLNEIANLKTKLVSAPSIDYETYSKLSDIENSVYRYNNFLRNGMQSNADNEAKKLMNFSEDEDITLQGGISNTKYIWRTEPKACKECQELDNTEYNNKEDIPEKPHPNCKCYVEEEKEDEDMCDCYEFFDNIDDVLKEAQILQNDVLNEKEDISRVIGNFSHYNSNLIQGLINDIISLEDPLDTLYQTISIFLTNYYQMLDADTHGADKYFHAKANCEAAQRGIVGEMIAKAIGDLREFVDSFKNIYIKKYTIEESLKDIQEDLEANQEGRDLGRQYPTKKPYELLKHRIPNGFPDRYKEE